MVVLRYFFLRANYRKPQEFSEALLDESKATFKNIENLIKSSEPSPKGWADVIKTAIQKIKT